MVELELMLLVAPEFARLSIVFVVVLLCALKLLASKSRRVPARTLPLFRAVSTGVLVVAPLFILTASLGLVAWGFMSRDDFHTALNFFWARDIVKQFAWLPFDMGVLYFLYPTVVLALFPSISLSRPQLFAVFISLLLLIGLTRVLNIVSLVVPAMLSPVQIFSCVVAAVLAALLAAPAASLSAAHSIPIRSNPWIALCVALLFQLASIALEINYGQSLQTYYSLLIVSACMSVCAVSTVLAVFHSPLAIQPRGESAPIVSMSPDTVYSPTASMYGSPMRAGQRVSASADSDFLTLRDPFASPPPGQLSPMMREKARPIGYPRRGVPDRGPAPQRPRRPSTTSAMDSFDQAFLERLVSLSFASSASDDLHALSEAKLELAPAARISHVHLPLSPRARPSSGSSAGSESSARSVTPTPAPRTRMRRTVDRVPTPAAELALLGSPAASSRDWTRQLEVDTAAVRTLAQQEEEDSESSDERDLDASLEMALR